MKDNVGVYFCIEKYNNSYKLNYVIKDITTNVVFMKIKKNLKGDTSEKRTIESLEHLLNNVISLEKIKEIKEKSEIRVFTNNKSSRIILSKSNNTTYSSLKFFLDKINLKEIVEYRNIGRFLKKEKQVSMNVYIKCKKAGKEYRKIINRNSTLEKLKKSIETAKTLVFFDFEMNCLVDFKSVEIISIGACKIDLKTKDISRYYNLIKPQEVSELTQKCIEITALNQEEIDNANEFNNVFENFGQWINDEKALFLFWGGNDISVLKNDFNRNLKKSKDALRIITNNIDFQEVLCKDILNREDMLSLTNGLIEANLEFKGSQHNSGDDAYNLFRIYREFEKRLVLI
ncbi:MAG: exonuclease domain-containing protein [Clostridium sp.]|uniref:exonuclease domain-containing protein n=1 Tax=Clostridium sp. TaxID=1506 RepID=UPI003EE81358